MKRYFLPICLNICILAISCTSVREILPGYKMYATPNGADKPGRVYRLGNDNKTDFLVEYLEVNPKGEIIIIPEREQTKSFNLGSLVSFISNGTTNITTTAGVDLRQTSKFKIKLNEAQVYKVSDRDLVEIYPDLKKRLLNDSKILGHKDPKYFIVREAVTAKDIFIQMDKSLASNLEVKASLDKLINGQGNVKWTNAAKDEIKVSLNEGLFVFYKPERIIISTSIDGNGDISITEIDKKSLDQLSIGN